jgi:lipopolysaccharide export system protein LptC
MVRVILPAIVHVVEPFLQLIEGLYSEIVMLVHWEQPLLYVMHPHLSLPAYYLQAVRDMNTADNTMAAYLNECVNTCSTCPEPTTAKVGSA